MKEQHMTCVTMILTEEGFARVRNSLLAFVGFDFLISTELEPEKRRIYLYTRDITKVRAAERRFGADRIETTW